MKNIRNKLIFAILALGFTFIGIYLATNEEDQAIDTISEPNTTLPSFSSNAVNVESIQRLHDNVQTAKSDQQMLGIINNQHLSRIDKINQLVESLKQNNADPQVLTNILVTLTRLNPIEAIDDIIPYLKYGNPRVQIAALGALNNASLLTEEEHRIKKALPQNELVRKRIADAVNDLNSDPHTFDEVRQALISTYFSTNPSVEDTKKMSQEIVSKNKVSLNEASYLATCVLNGRDVSATLNILNTKDKEMRDDVIISIGANIIDNPNVVTLLSKEQRKELHAFISSNPPSTTNPNDFDYQTGQWKNTLSLLNID